MNIIAVDDEQSSLNILTRAIKKTVPDCSLAAFTSSADALDNAKSLIQNGSKLDIAFLDINMADMNGLILAKHLKDIHGKTNIVFVTAYSQYATDAMNMYASGYVMKPATPQTIFRELENLRHPVDIKSNAKVFVQTFGNFDIFLDGKPIVFSRSKAKEILAYLIDRQGTSVKATEIAAVLWENREYNNSLKSQIQTIVASMMQTLRKYGIEEIVTKSWNQISIDKTKIKCDYYDLLNWDSKAVNAYCGEYMSNYSWAEMTTAVLNQKTRVC